MNYIRQLITLFTISTIVTTSLAGMTGLIRAAARTSRVLAPKVETFYRCTNPKLFQHNCRMYVQPTAKQKSGLSGYVKRYVTQQSRKYRGGPDSGYCIETKRHTPTIKKVRKPDGSVIFIMPDVETIKSYFFQWSAMADFVKKTRICEMLAGEKTPLEVVVAWYSCVEDYEHCDQVADWSYYDNSGDSEDTGNAFVIRANMCMRKALYKLMYDNFGYNTQSDVELSLAEEVLLKGLIRIKSD